MAMRNLKEEGKLKSLIQINQEKLNKLIVEKDFELQNEEIIKLSKYIDELLVDFSRFKLKNQ